MNAFSKELAGLLCSDFQVDRVMNDKIMPEIIDITANRVEDEIKAIQTVYDSVKSCALDAFTNYSIRSGFDVKITSLSDVYKIYAIVREWFCIDQVADYMSKRCSERNIKHRNTAFYELKAYMCDIELAYRSIKKELGRSNE